MSQIEKIDLIPDWEWLEHSQTELAASGKREIQKITDTIYRVSNVAVVGFIYYSMTSPPWMWFLLAEGIGIKELLDFRRLTLEIPSGTLTGVMADYELGIRFAKLYGFEDTGVKQEVRGVAYRIFRRR